MTAGAIEALLGQNVNLDAKKNSQNATGNIASSATKAQLAYMQLDGRDTVSLSNFVPAPFSAKLLESADNKANKMINHAELKRTEIAELREDNVQRAMVAMRLMERGDGSLPDATWVTGMIKPSAREMEEAYRRLTQRLVDVGEASDIGSARQMRLDLLDAFRGYQWENFAELIAS